ncbi:hypothetical protein MCOR25_004292 [Pyricularia grisea]|nr:hypothetical protein MCOR25_004292 [Pyricularia grisea]
MQNCGAPAASCRRPAPSPASTTSNSVGQQQQQHPASRQGSTMTMGNANENGRDQGGDQAVRPGLRKIASSFDKVKRAFTFRSDNNGGTSSRPGSSCSRSGVAAASEAWSADLGAPGCRPACDDSNVDEPVRQSRVGEEGESENDGAVELTQANPRFSYDSDHASPC